MQSNRFWENWTHFSKYEVDNAYNFIKYFQRTQPDENGGLGVVGED